MRFTKVPSYVAPGVRWTILLVSALTLRLVDPACAAELQANAPQTTTASLAVTRNGIAFDIVIYRPPTQQQRGTVLLLHGFPGSRIGEGFSPSTRSLATSLANSGYSVVRFNYIGSWANGGQFSWFGGVLDTEAILRFLRTDEARRLGIDGSRIVLVGHSYGGWVALMTAARDPTVRCVATMASANMGRTGQLIRDDRALYEQRVALYQETLRGPEPPIRAESAKALADDVMDHAEGWDLTNHIEQLRSKQLFFVNAEQDTLLPQQLYRQPLIDGLLQANAPTLRTAAIEGADHNFSQHGPQVNNMIESWITKECKL
jgi:pimeloyl-ACP methyl ester carboxylesterase